jgi:hypothetical protein
MEQSLSWETNSCSATQQISYLVQKPVSLCKRQRVNEFVLRECSSSSSSSSGSSSGSGSGSGSSSSISSSSSSSFRSQVTPGDPTGFS